MKLVDAGRKIISLLNSLSYNYLVIGGIAANILGEPRVTGDIDLCIFITKKKVVKFLAELTEAGFIVDKEDAKKSIKETGTFRVYCEKIPIDFIIASTKFEQSALKRKIEVKIFDVKTNIPSPEDLILFKVLPGRPIDISDAENIAKRYSGKLDAEYLQNWSKTLSSESEDMRIYNEVERLLNL